MMSATAASPRERYAARIDELASLEFELDAGKRPQLAPVIGRVLEAAGDLLRRQTALAADLGFVRRVLGKIPEAALRAWGDGVDATALRTMLHNAASQAVEAAIPDSPEDGERMTGWAMQGLYSRDRLESSLTALRTLGTTGRHDAVALVERLQKAVDEVDASCRPQVTSLTALNANRRPEAALLDAPAREKAWWFSARTGIDDDLLVAVLGGEKKGTLPRPEKAASEVVVTKRGRRVSSDDLLRFDLGLATPAEQATIRRQAEVDPELKLALAAMAAGDEAIDEVAAPAAPVSLPVERRSEDKPSHVEQHPEFKVLVFRNVKSVQVVVQPRNPDRFAAAAVFRAEEPGRPLSSRPTGLGFEFDLGAPEVNARAKVVVTLKDGQSHQLDVPLRS
jgi:hypothetical protein